MKLSRRLLKMSSPRLLTSRTLQPRTCTSPCSRARAKSRETTKSKSYRSSRRPRSSGHSQDSDDTRTQYKVNRRWRMVQHRETKVTRRHKHGFPPKSSSSQHRKPGFRPLEEVHVRRTFV